VYIMCHSKRIETFWMLQLTSVLNRYGS